MKFLVYAALLFACGLMFLPPTGTTEIRNLPLWVFILFYEKKTAVHNLELKETRMGRN